MLLPESLNRSIAQCTENSLPAVCVKVKVCFRVGGKQIPGNICKTIIPIKHNLNLKSVLKTVLLTSNQQYLCNKTLQRYKTILQLPAVLSDFLDTMWNDLWFFELPTRALRVEYTAFKDERFGLKLFVCERLCVGTSYQHVLKAVAVRCASALYLGPTSPLLLWRLEGSGCVSRPAFTDRSTLSDQIVNNRAVLDDKYS